MAPEGPNWWMCVLISVFVIDRGSLTEYNEEMSCETGHPGSVHEHSYCLPGLSTNQTCVGVCQIPSLESFGTDRTRFQCTNGVWVIDEPNVTALVCRDDQNRDVWLADGVYYRFLGLWLPFGGALERAAAETYGGLSGHLSTPINAKEEHVITTMASDRAYDTFDSMFADRTWLGIRNVADIITPIRYYLRANAESQNIFLESQNQVFFEPDEPIWNWVDGPLRGETVWKGTCQGCCDQPHNCAGLPNEGYASSSRYSNWGDGNPKATYSCAAVSKFEGWRDTVCNDIHKLFTYGTPPNTTIIGIHRSIVQFRKGYVAKTKFSACAAEPTCECTKTASKLIPMDTNNTNFTNKDSFEGLRKISQNVLVFGAGGIQCKSLYLNSVPEFDGDDPRFKDPIVDELARIDDRLLIDLSYNQLTFIEAKHFVALTTLRSLLLNYNLFTSVPRLVNPELETLVLANNPITVAHRCVFQGLPNLISLSLKFTEIEFTRVLLSPSGGVFFQLENPRMEELIHGGDNGSITIQKDVSSLSSHENTTCMDITLRTSTRTSRTMTTTTTTTVTPVVLGSENKVNTTPVIVVSVVVVMFVLTFVSTILYIRFQRRQKVRRWQGESADIQNKLQQQSKHVFDIYYGSIVGDENTVAFEAKFQALAVDALGSDLKNRKILSTGVFGVVYKTDLVMGKGKQTRATTLAVKCCKPGDVAGSMRLLVEARLMLLLQHPSILPVVAVKVKSLRPWLATTFLPHGDLQKLLRKLRQDQLNNLGKEKQSTSISTSTSKISTSTSTSTSPSSSCVLIPPTTLTQVLVRVCDALVYLETIGVVHADVAARNVLVGDALPEVYLHDFGSALPARASGHLDTKYSAAGVAIPFRWMAPESLLESSYTHKSDVFAFGVLIWECCTYGKTPHGALGHHEVQELLIKGAHLSIPKQLSVEGLDKIMSRCWASLPRDRPTFAMLKTQLLQLNASTQTPSTSTLAPLRMTILTTTSKSLVSKMAEPATKAKAKTTTTTTTLPTLSSTPTPTPTPTLTPTLTRTPPTTTKLVSNRAFDQSVIELGHSQEKVDTNVTPVVTVDGYMEVDCDNDEMRC